MRAIKRMTAFALVILQIVVLSLPAVAVEENFLSWYCIRTEGNKQPPSDDTMRLAEKYQGYYIDRKHGDNDADKVLYLTFDAGYENGNVSKILDVLKEEQVCGAFFILGNLVQKNPELILRMQQEGHFVCHHTTHHKNMAMLKSKDELREELRPLEESYLALTGEPLRPYLRPPEGCFSEESMKFTSELGYKTIFWSFAYDDWDNHRQPSPTAAKEKILKYVHNGAVILLHPTSETNVIILQDVILELKAQGYRFGNLDELTASSPQPRIKDVSGEGNVYCKGTDLDKKIALTFDDGPHPRYTEAILNILAEYDVPATFFVVGVNAMAYPGALKKIVDSGCEIGNHTMHHAKLSGLNEHQIREEMHACAQILYQLSEVTPSVLRPPGGHLSDSVKLAACEMGYDVVLWSVDTRDWASTPSEEICHDVLHSVQAGDIILMHDYVSGKNTTCESLRQIIPVLLKQGYEFVTVSELLQQEKPPVYEVNPKV